MKAKLLILCFLSNCSIIFNQNHKNVLDTCFTLVLREIGFGSNMFDLTPSFKIEGNKYVYSLKQYWNFPTRNDSIQTTNQTLDTLKMGIVNAELIKSISEIVDNIKGDTIYRLSSGIMSGSSLELTIQTPLKSIHFSLNNAYDSNAEKIIQILNTLIVGCKTKLYISNQKPNINRIIYRKKVTNT